MSTPFNFVTGDAQRALEVFSQAMAMALVQSPVEQWAEGLGYFNEVSRAAIKSTYPVPVSAAGYKEFLGDVKYRTLFEKSLELKHKTWQDGVEELAAIIEAPDFTGWLGEPERIATAGMSLANEIVAGLLEANGTSWTGVTFFNAAHPINLFESGLGTFDNDVTGAGTDPTHENLKVAKETFRGYKAPNGKPMGLRMTHVLVPAAQEELWKDLLEQDLIIQSMDGGTTFGAVTNRHKGTVKPIVSDELTNALQWYPLALNKPGMFPWIVEAEAAPEEIRCDKTSQKYKDTLKVSVAYVKRANGVLALPHCVQRWAGTAP